MRAALNARVGLFYCADSDVQCTAKRERQTAMIVQECHTWVMPPYGGDADRPVVVVCLCHSMGRVMTAC